MIRNPGVPIFLSLLALSALCLAGCGKSEVCRVEWPVMGTIAAIQVRGGESPMQVAGQWRSFSSPFFEKVERCLNAHDPDSEICRLASLSDDEVIARCDDAMRVCYAAAFDLAKASGGAFNPRWRGTNTLDLGAIAKGFAVDVIAEASYVSGGAALLDLGGNLKVPWCGGVKPWRTGVKDPNGGGFAAVVELREHEALATSATYYRGSHICDGRTGLAVSNGVASVTVLCNSAMWADGLSTTLFVLGPEDGSKFLDDKLESLVGGMAVSALWIMDGGRKVTYGNARFQGN